RLHALVRERAQLFVERPATDLEVGRAAAEDETPRLARGADLAGRQLRGVDAHRPHADCDRVDLRAQVVDTSARVGAGNPSGAGHGNATVKGERQLQHDE